MQLPTVRHQRPDYVDPSARYVPWPHVAGEPPELSHDVVPFATSHRRRMPSRIRLMILVGVGVVIGFVLLAFLAFVATRPLHGSTEPRPIFVTPSTYGYPSPPTAPEEPDAGFTTMPAVPDALRWDIIWTRRGG